MLLSLAAKTLTSGDRPWGTLQVLLLLCIAVNAPFMALSAATGLIGFTLRMVARDAVAAVLPTSGCAATEDKLTPVTALAVCVRDEPVEAIAKRLSRLLAGLIARGHDEGFTACLLSDTADEAIALREATAAAGLVARFGQARVIYRRRLTNDGFKAGNVMDFLDQYADDFELMLCLDADSEMSADTVLRMVSVMCATPRLAILQATFAGRPAATLFPRLLQIGHRQGLRVWATGQAWWVAPFRKHCRLRPLPDGTPILSHDHVEAARLHAAGWAVRVLPDDTGSHEEQPPSLPEFIRRDARWAAGNLQYCFLLHRRELGWLGRLQMLQAVLHYALTPFWFAMLPLAALLAATGAAAIMPNAPLAALLGLGVIQLHAPKLLGTLEALLRPAVAHPLGGRAAVLRSALADGVFTLLLDPILAFTKMMSLFSLILHRQVGWAGSARSGARLGWKTALQLFWPQTLIGVLLSILFAEGSWEALLLALPATLGLLLSIPFAVVTSGSTPSWLYPAIATDDELDQSTAPRQGSQSA